MLSDELTLGRTLGLPEHYIQIEAIKAIEAQTGRDLSGYLRHAPAQNNIPETEVMLEPTELGARAGLSAVRMNRVLAGEGFQEKINGHWQLTEKGKPYCATHAWRTGAKSGYNLKWNIKILYVLGETEQ